MFSLCEMEEYLDDDDFVMDDEFLQGLDRIEAAYNAGVLHTNSTGQPNQPQNRQQASLHDMKKVTDHVHLYTQALPPGQQQVGWNSSGLQSNQKLQSAHQQSLLKDPTAGGARGQQASRSVLDVVLRLSSSCVCLFA